MKEEKHDFLQVLFVIEGRALLKAGQSATDLKGGYIYVVPIGQEHQLNDDPGNPLSLYVLSGMSRYSYTHELLPSGSAFDLLEAKDGVPPRRVDVVRGRRLSIIFRDVHCDSRS